MADRNENLKQVYYALDKSMMVAHRKRDDESRRSSEHTALTLLEYSDLPLYIRARACMILGLSDVRVDYLEHAKEGVRIMELAISEIQKAGGEPGPVTQRLLKNCTNVLKKAERDYENGGEEMIAQKIREEAEAHEDDEEEDDQGSDEGEEGGADEEEDPNVMSGIAEPQKTGEDDEMLLGHTADSGDTPAEQGVTQAPSNKHKRVRRVHSGDADEEAEYEEFDRATGAWVPLNTAVEPEYVDDDMLFTEGEEGEQGM